LDMASNESATARRRGSKGIGAPASPVRRTTLIAGLAGVAFGYWIAVWISDYWPIVVGGKAIAAWRIPMEQGIARSQIFPDGVHGPLQALMVMVETGQREQEKCAVQFIRCIRPHVAVAGAAESAAVNVLRQSVTLILPTLAVRPSHSEQVACSRRPIQRQAPRSWSGSGRDAGVY